MSFGTTSCCMMTAQLSREPCSGEFRLAQEAATTYVGHDCSLKAP